MSGISRRTSRGSFSSSHNFEGELASPEKRQALPTIAMGSFDEVLPGIVCDFVRSLTVS